MKYNHYTIESLICTICHFDNKLELLHHKKLGQFLGNIPVIAGENKAGTIFSCSWGKTVLYQGFDLGIYFPALAPAIAWNITSPPNPFIIVMWSKIKHN